ncbi:C-C motif chemokine 17-like [Chanos chanos]|uniref:C-C motif chemokine n=1 Tax=Chanos chanos TaxID=29144 RepID=A0A6J2W8B9_CHACN|nr:C-C motif chemokine 17-like [Chanos chanos]
MAVHRLILLSLVVILSAVTVSEGLRLASRPKKCCFGYQDGRLGLAQVTGYFKTSPQCSKEAILFKTIKGRFVCAKPSDSWVKELMNKLDVKMNGKQIPF